MFSLNQELIDKILNETMPSFQATNPETDNMGFGFIFYSLTRALRPEKTVVIGSKAGFSVICFALGIKDNTGHTIDRVECYDTKLKFKGQRPILHFIDPSYSMDNGDLDHWYGIDFWNDPKKVVEHWKKFGVDDIIRHFKVRSDEYLQQDGRLSEIDLLYIDGDHSYNGISHDFNAFYPLLKKNAIIIAHDVDPALKEADPDTGGYKALTDLDKRCFEWFRLPIFPGLALIRKI